MRLYRLYTSYRFGNFKKNRAADFLEVPEFTREGKDTALFVVIEQRKTCLSAKTIDRLTLPQRFT